MRFLAWVTTAVLLAGSMATAQETALRQITVTGEGRVAAAPDMATLRLGAAAEAKEAGEALRQTSDITQRILDRLGEAGIEARDIQTSGLSLSPLRQNYREGTAETPGIAGYAASNGVTVRLRDLDRLGEVLDAVVSDGANTLDGLSFGLQEPRPLMDEARQLAVADARAKAELYAKARVSPLGRYSRLLNAGEDRRARIWRKCRWRAGLCPLPPESWMSRPTCRLSMRSRNRSATLLRCGSAMF